MAILSYTDFTGALNIPISGINTQQLITDYISAYEKIILTDLLGYELYKEFMTEIAEPSPDVKWTKLQNGSEFTMSYGGSNYLTYFNGIKSIAAAYVYCRFRSKNETFFNGQTQVQSTSENADIALFDEYIIPIYNEMVKSYGKVSYCFNELTPSANYGQYDLYPSAYNYLRINIADFPKWIFTPKHYINVYGI